MTRGSQPIIQYSCGLEIIKVGLNVLMERHLYLCSNRSGKLELELSVGLLYGGRVGLGQNAGENLCKWFWPFIR